MTPTATLIIIQETGSEVMDIYVHWSLAYSLFFLAGAVVMFIILIRQIQKLRRG